MISRDKLRTNHLNAIGFHLFEKVNDGLGVVCDTKKLCYIRPRSRDGFYVVEWYGEGDTTLTFKVIETYSKDDRCLFLVSADFAMQIRLLARPLGDYYGVGPAIVVFRDKTHWVVALERRDLSVEWSLLRNVFGVGVYARHLTYAARGLVPLDRAAAPPRRRARRRTRRQ